jgi:hypothetical protein
MPPGSERILVRSEIAAQPQLVVTLIDGWHPVSCHDSGRPLAVEANPSVTRQMVALEGVGTFRWYHVDFSPGSGIASGPTRYRSLTGPLLGKLGRSPNRVRGHGPTLQRVSLG